MTILHLTTFLQGGAGRIITALAIHQRRAGHAVAVVASKSGAPGYGNYDAYLRELHEAGVVVRLVDSMFVRESAANARVVDALDRLLPPGAEPDIVHAHAAVPALVGLVWAGGRGRGIPVVQTMHGWGVRKTAAQTRADVGVMNLVRAVAVPSRHARLLLTELGVAPARIDVLPYGVAGAETSADPDARDRALIAEMTARHRAGALVAACVGTVGARKNQQLVVRAVAALAGDRARTAGPMNRGPRTARRANRGRRSSAADVFVVFVGDGDNAELQAAIDGAGVGPMCRVHGYSAAARRIAAAADVLVLPSRNEGQPISVLEAFADGPLAVVSDIPELVELVDDGVTGVVFRQDDAVALAAALERTARLAPAGRQAMAARARAVYESTFSFASMVARYERWYEGALGPGSWALGVGQRAPDVRVSSP